MSAALGGTQRSAAHRNYRTRRREGAFVARPLVRSASAAAAAPQTATLGFIKYHGLGNDFILVGSGAAL